MSQTVFRPITPEILIASKPFTRFGFLPWGGRSTFIFLPSNELFIVVSTPLDERTRTSLHEFAGTEWESKVAYLLAPVSPSRPLFASLHPCSYERVAHPTSDFLLSRRTTSTRFTRRSGRRLSPPLRSSLRRLPIFPTSTSVSSHLDLAANDLTSVDLTPLSFSYRLHPSRSSR